VSQWETFCSELALQKIEYLLISSGRGYKEI